MFTGIPMDHILRRLEQNKWKNKETSGPPEQQGATVAGKNCPVGRNQEQNQSPEGQRSSTND